MTAQHLRRIDLHSFPPIKERCVTLIALHRKKPDTSTFATTVEGKRTIIELPRDEYQFIAIWTGKYQSDAFAVNTEVLDAWKEDLFAPPKQRKR